MFKAIGAHCYLGGFLIGVQRAGIKLVKSLETWKTGQKGAKELGLPSEKVDEIPDKTESVDIVVGNPPCSRFSHLSLSFFDKKDHEDPGTFPEILDLIKLVKASNSKAIWWETGPLSWSIGQKLIRNYHKKLNKEWGPTTTLLARLDLRYIGIPQKRPRVHIIHLKGSEKPPAVPKAVWPSDYRVGDWLKEKVNGYELSTPVFKEEAEDPVEWARKKDAEMTFRSMVPKIISKDDWYTNSVVSRRIMVWEEENRWFDFLEHAALMTYPLDTIKNILSLKKDARNAQVLISKSVAPGASKWVADEIVIPWLKKESIENPIKPKMREKGIWELDLTIPNYIDRNLRRGQSFFNFDNNIDNIN